jgi:hypothetical protein
VVVVLVDLAVGESLGQQLFRGAPAAVGRSLRARKRTRAITPTMTRAQNTTMPSVITA